MSNITKINLIWITILLVLVIIILAVLLFGKIDACNQPIVHYLSITATIMSITLSVFSIAFSYYSLTSSSEQWNKINAAIAEMKTANDAIKDNNQMLFENVVRITNHIGQINARQQWLKDKEDDSALSNQAPLDIKVNNGVLTDQQSRSDFNQEPIGANIVNNK